MTMEDRIRLRLEAVFAPVQLSIVNESHLHAGHHGSPGTGSSHFRVHVVSHRFAGISRIDRHRLVNEALTAELKDGVHALAVKAEAPATG
jgi:BolA family transcriptional regulator, general stress-responsive regulator